MRPAGGLLSAAGALLALTLAGCRSEDPAGDLAAVAARPARSAAPTAALWGRLAAAVADEDDGLARVLVERLRPWVETAGEAARLRAFERVLGGRELVGRLSLRLVSEPTERRGVHRVVLLGSQSGVTELVLRLPPARLSQLRRAVNAAGGQARDLGTTNVEVLSELELLPGRTSRVVLTTSEIVLDGALAVRERWSLHPLSGEIESEGEVYPAVGVSVEPCERVRLADELPLAPVPLEELLRYARGPAIRTPALLERAVRLSSTRRGEALEALAPLVATWARIDPERVDALAPALRWLTGTGQSSLSPAEWAELLRHAIEPPERPRLDFDTEGSRALERGGRAARLSRS